MTEKIIGIVMSAAAARLKVPREYIPPDIGYEQSLFEKITDTVMTAIIFTLFGVYLIYLIICIFYKGRKIRIFVVRKRVNSYKVYSKYGTGIEEHCVVYAKYPNSDKIHTLSCDGNIYSCLHENKRYTVTVKLMRIKKVHREKFKSKKKK